MTKTFKPALLLASVALVAGLGIGGASAHDWNGFYAGVNVGAGFASQPWDNIVVPSDPGYGRPGERIGETQPSSFIGGGQVGWNDQFDGDWVFGVEASFDGGNYGGHFDCFGGGEDYTGDCGTHSTWNADFTARLGAVLNNALFYVKAGGELRDLTAHARDIHSRECCYFAGSYHDSSNTPFGWVVGAGVEFAISDELTGGLEYDYSDVEATADMVPMPDSDTEIILPFNVNVAQRTSAVTFRLNYHLGND